MVPTTFSMFRKIAEDAKELKTSLQKGDSSIICGNSITSSTECKKKINSKLTGGENRSVVYFSCTNDDDQADELRDYVTI